LLFNLPTYTQAPACGYPLSYQLNLLQKWNNASTPPSYEIMPADSPAPNFVFFNDPAKPAYISLKSDLWTDD
jgi:hypothetical protein